MKKIFLLLTLITFVGTTTVTPVLAADNAIICCEKCSDKDKKCGDKDKKACAKASKKGCCSKSAGGAKSCTAKTDGEKSKCHSKAEVKTEDVKSEEVK